MLYQNRINIIVGPRPLAPAGPLSSIYIIKKPSHWEKKCGISVLSF